MNIFKLWKWCKENEKTKPLGIQNTKPIPRPVNQNPPALNKKLPSPPPIHYTKEDSSKSKRNPHGFYLDVEPSFQDKAEERLSKLEERVDFLWKGSVEPRVIILERDLSKLYDAFAAFSQELLKYNEALNKAIENNNNLTREFDKLNKSFPYAFADTYHLAERFNALVTILQEQGLLKDLEITKVVKH